MKSSKESFSTLAKLALLLIGGPICCLFSMLGLFLIAYAFALAFTLLCWITSHLFVALPALGLFALLASCTGRTRNR